MILHTDKKVYIEFSDFMEAGWKEATLWKANQRKGSNWIVIKNPSDLRKPMVQYETLTEANKEKIQLWLRKINGCKHDESVTCSCGSPYEYLAKEPIRQMVKKDFKAETFYMTYRYIGTNGKSTALPAETIAKYTNEASYLNMLVNVNNNMKELVKKALNLTVDAFYNHLEEILKAEIAQGTITGKFPTSYKKLLPKIKKYQAEGYPSLIQTFRFANNNAAKVADDVSESLLLELLDHPNQYDDVLIAEQYNKWAVENEREPITAATVGVWRRKNHLQNREGREAYNKNVRRKVSRNRPSQPTFLWESDDNHIDWWFQGDKANEYRKIKGIIITDSFNDYPLGWAITDAEMPGDLVRLAYLNAMYHVRELTGGWYLPHEVKTDQWNIKQLRPFYQGIGHYYDTPVGSKNRGWLENFFGHIDWERSLKIANNNYTGHNITARKRGVNMEAVQANRANWPHISEAGVQMEAFIERLRKMPRNYDSNNKSRQQEWLEAWAAMPDEKKIQINDEQMLMKFGFRHKNENRITDQGIKPTISGTQYHYEIPHEHYLHNHGKKVEIIYDPMNMNRVLLTDNEGLRIVANTVQKVAGCMADMQDGGRTLLNKILSDAKADAASLTTASIKRQSLLLNEGISAEDIIKLGVIVPKEQKQIAEARYGLPEVKEEAEVIHIPAKETEFNVYQSILKR